MNVLGMIAGVTIRDACPCANLIRFITSVSLSFSLSLYHSLFQSICLESTHHYVMMVYHHHQVQTLCFELMKQDVYT